MKKTIQRRIVAKQRKAASEQTLKSPTIAFAATKEEYDALRGLSAASGLSMSGVLFAHGQRKVIDSVLLHWDKVKKSLRPDAG